MATAGLYSIGGSFWEFGEPDWDRTKYLLMFGVAEDHDSNPIKTGLAKLKARGAKFVSLNPVQTGYSALADEFLAILEETDENDHGRPCKTDKKHDFQQSHRENSK